MSTTFFGHASLATLLGLGSVVIVACSAPPIPADDNPVGTDNAPSKKPTKGTDGTQVKEVDASVPDGQTAAACVTVAPNNRCGLAPQCGCGTNETCDVTNQATGATSCVTAGGATLGRPCTTTGDCLAGLACEYGACRPYCGTTGSKCAVGGTDLCVQVDSDADGKPVPNKLVCTINCDPRQPSAVCGTNACQWYPDLYAPNKLSDCNFGGTTQAFDDKLRCVDTTDCLPGLACVKHPKYGMECEPWCRIGQAPSACPSGTVCTDFFAANAPVINGVKEGVCQ